MKRRFIFALWGWLLQLPLFAQSTSLPERTVENVSDGIIVTYIFNEPEILVNEWMPETSFWRYAGFGQNDVIGQPSIPFRRDMFAIPSGYATDISIIEAEYRDTMFYMSPAIHNTGEGDIVMDSISDYQGFFPDGILRCDSLQSFRGIGLQRLVITPVQYDKEHHVARAYTKIKYKITYIEDMSPQSPRPEIWWDLDIWAGEIYPERYLVVSVSEYENAIQEFIEWKRTMGMDVFVSMKDRGEWTSEAVKDSVASYFQRYRIKYLLIVGGENDVPSINHSDYYYGLMTDSSYIPQIFRGRIPMNTSADVSVALGKIISYEREPIMEDSFYQKGLHCAEFVDEDRDFYPPPPRIGFVIGPDEHEDGCAVLVSEEIRHHLEQNYEKDVNYVYSAEEDINPTCWDRYDYSNGDSIPQELLRPSFGWDGNTDDIIEAINGGISYVLYSGRSDGSSWASPSFDVSDVNYLENANKLPVVFSMSDETGMYQNSDSITCLAEALLKKENGGSVAVIAPTTYISKGNAGAVTLSMFETVWPGMELQYGNFYLDAILQGAYEWEDPWGNICLTEDYWEPVYSVDSTHISMYELGKILDRSLCKLTETTSLDYGLPNEWISFHCFGDPSMKIRPQKPNVFVEPDIYISATGKLHVNVLDGYCNIIVHNKESGKINVYWSDHVMVPYISSNIVICLLREGYAPYVWDFSKDLYIQNETIQDKTRTYRGGTIKVGKHVTDTKTQGDVNFVNSNITINGKRLELHPGTYIDSNFKFQNQ